MLQGWRWKSWQHALCDRSISKGHREGPWRAFLQGGEGLFFVMDSKLWCFSLSLFYYWLMSWFCVKGGIVFPGRWTSYSHISWFCFCYYGQCWGCEPLHQVSQPISFRRSIHNRGEGNPILSLLLRLNSFVCLSSLTWRFSGYIQNSIVSAMLAAIKDDEIIHLNLSQTSLINGHS